MLDIHSSGDLRFGYLASSISNPTVSYLPRVDLYYIRVLTIDIHPSQYQSVRSSKRQSTNEPGLDDFDGRANHHRRDLLQHKSEITL